MEIVFIIIIAVTDKNISLFIIITIVIILGINPSRGGIPAILINTVNKIKLLILLNLKYDINWNKKFLLFIFMIFVAVNVISQ